MTTGQPSDPQDDIRAELERVEPEIVDMRRIARELREQLAENPDAATDPSDRAEAITMAEQQEALAEVLEARRDELRRRLERP